MSNHIKFTFTLLFVLVFVTCGMAQIEERPENPNTEIRYYGTGCFTIERAGSVLFTDPFISNPSATQVMFGKVKTDVEYVDTYINPATFKKVKMVVAGHAHYDHLMDMPYLSKYIPESTPIVSNRTAKHILAFYDLPQQTIVVNDIWGTDQQEGYWYYNAERSMRTMAFKSQHPPHFAGINLMNKLYTSDLKSEPLLMNDWQEGKTLAFMVDWLEEDSIIYRAYISSSLAKAPFGLFPKSLLDEHSVDDLFISAALFRDFDAAPKPLIDLAKPKRIILMHWENFFRSKEKEVKALNEKELNQLISKLQEEYGDATTIIKPEPLNYY